MSTKRTTEKRTTLRKVRPLEDLVKAAPLLVGDLVSGLHLNYLALDGANGGVLLEQCLLILGGIELHHDVASPEPADLSRTSLTHASNS